MNLGTDKGFTFIETIISISIILILSAAVGLSSIKYIDRARIASCKNQIETYKMALQSYYLDCGQYPTEAQTLNALWEKPIMSPVPVNWDGPYTDRQLSKDPWGNNYIYKNPGEKNLPYTIISLGSDGKYGTTGSGGSSADIYSWE